MAEALCARQIDCMASVATEYGREVMRQQEHLVIREGRMGEPEMEELMRTGTFLAVVDATHPYAVEVTEHIKESAKKTNLPYLRLSRSTAAEREIAEHEWMIHTVADTQECVELLSKLPGNILLTTGSKELHAYAAREGGEHRNLPQGTDSGEADHCHAGTFWNGAQRGADPAV